MTPSKNGVTYTIIIQFANNRYHVGETDDPTNYLKSKKRGFYTHNGNDVARIIKCFRGKWSRQIKSMGIKTFLLVLQSEDIIMLAGITLFE